jgi:hypothetical protein
MIGAIGDLMIRIIPIIVLISKGAVGLGAQPGAPPEPRALKPAPAMTVDQLRKAFADPAAEYRSMPLWVWNDEMDAGRVKEMLQQYRRQGMGGAFVHPRPGLMTEYLGPEWFRMWGEAIQEGKRLGLSVNIYDENSYPSGFSGGHVPALVPDTASQFILVESGLPASAVTSRPQHPAFFAGPPGDPAKLRRVRTPEEVRAGEEVVAFRLRRASGNAWTAGFPYVDLTNPRTAQAFIETTYEAYRREIGAEFGKTVRWAFTDEPLLATEGAYAGARMALPFSFETLAAFRRRLAYDLTDHLPSLYWDVGDWRKVRFDYWQTLHDLWIENFMRPVFEWCDRNGIEFTGHFMEHEWPYPWISPADASLHVYQHVPGIDLLGSQEYRPHYLFTIRQSASVSHQLGRRLLCETYGTAGWDSTMEHLKRFGDWMLVHGVNFVNQHLSYSTIRGARKRDYPPSFSDASAWWRAYRPHADHLARVSLVSSVTEARHRVLVIHPTTTGFLYARRGGPVPELDKMRENNSRLVQYFADRQVDFDYGDEYVLEWYGKVDGKRLRVGKAAYDVVVLSHDVANLRRQTVPLLAAWLKEGGTVLSLVEAPAHVDGRPSDAVRKLREQHPGQWVRVSGDDGLLAAIRERAPARIAVDAPLGFLERFLPSGDRVLFLANSTEAAIPAKASIEAAALEEWDTVTGQTRAYPFTRGGRGVEFAVQLPPAGSLLLVARKEAPASAAPAPPAWRPLPEQSWSGSTDEPNVFVLDYCDLETAGESHSGVHTWRANWIVWQRHGFERPAWDSSVQFRRNVLDRKFGEGTGFRAKFRFTAAGAPPKDLRLAVEAPDLYRISVNGQRVDFSSAGRWMDRHMKSVPAGALVKAGENEIVLEAAPFDSRMELENVYLLGDFALAPAEQGFQIAASRPLGLGGWPKQGRPFYSGTATYSARVQIPGGHRRLRVALKEWSGALAEVLVNGQVLGWIGWPPYETEVSVAPGDAKVEVRVYGTPRNLFGPFHHPRKVRFGAGPGSWAEFPESQPPGSAYDLLDYGLTASPALSTSP